jgi:hypothetical protein
MKPIQQNIELKEENNAIIVKKRWIKPEVLLISKGEIESGTHRSFTEGASPFYYAS